MLSHSRKPVVRVMTICVAFLLGYVALITVTRFWLRSSALGMANTVAGLQVGRTTRGEARTAMKRFAYYRADQSGDEDVFLISNAFRRFLPVVVEKSLIVRLKYKGETLAEKQLSYTEQSDVSGVLREGLPNVEKEASQSRFEENGRVFSVNRGAPPYFGASPAKIVIVVDSVSVDSHRRAEDWQLDLTCLVLLQRCEDLRSIFTGAFH